MRFLLLGLALVLSACATAEPAISPPQAATARLQADPGTEARIGVVEWEISQTSDLTRIYGIDRRAERRGNVAFVRSGGNGNRATLAIEAALLQQTRLVMTTEGFVLENTLPEDPAALVWLEELNKVGAASGDGMILKAGGWDCALQGGRVVRDCVPTAIGCATAETGLGAAVCLGGAWGCFESVGGINEACGVQPGPTPQCNDFEMGGNGQDSCANGPNQPQAEQPQADQPQGPNESNGQGENGENSSQDNGQNGDNGQGDNGQGDNGQGDNGQGDNGQGDNGSADNGQADDGSADNGQADDGSADNGQADDWGADDGSADDWGADDGSGDDGSGDDGSGDDGSGDDWGSDA